MSYLAGIAGYRGYSGAELVRILSKHPSIETVLLEHREAPGDGPRYLGMGPSLRTVPMAAAASEGFDVIFLATPHEVSAELTPGLLASGVKVIDLSGAFRLKTDATHSRWYPDVASDPKLLAEAAYGLPEFYRDTIRGARLVANPGCYPTAANLAIRPLVAHGIAERDAGIVCDAKSGVSGAGRKPALKTSFCEVTENFSAYSVLHHRHVPEVLMNSGLEEAEFSFTAQLLPIDRGILETIYFRASRDLTAEAILRVYEQCYEDETFVRLHAPGSTPTLAGVARTNFCDLAIHFDQMTGRGVIISAIDNLGKGAAGQAIQNMNLLLGIPEELGLL